MVNGAILAVALIAGASIGLVLRDDGGGGDTEVDVGVPDGRATTSSGPAGTTSSQPAVISTSSSVTEGTVADGSGSGSGGATDPTPIKPTPTNPTPTNPTPIVPTPIVPTPTNPPPAAHCNTNSGNPTSNQVAERFCQHRASRGLALMRRTGNLDSAAQSWAAFMAQQDAPSHSDVSKIAAKCSSPCASAGENIADNTSGNPQGAWDFWLNSQVHRSNIDNAHSGEFGVGAARGPSGRMYYVQMFGWY